MASIFFIRGGSEWAVAALGLNRIHWPLHCRGHEAADPDSGGSTAGNQSVHKNPVGITAKLDLVLAPEVPRGFQVRCVHDNSLNFNPMRSMKKIYGDVQSG
jgi:hypothetical protein